MAHDLPFKEALAIRQPALLALTLAVRQATAYDLGALLAEEGLRVVVSATVPTALPHAANIPATVHIPDDAAPGDEMDELLAAHGRAAILGVADRPDRVRGLAPATVARIAARPDVDAVVVIADGSRHRPVKALAEHEPALPPGATHVLPMVSLDALGQPLTEEHVHRPELLARLLGVSEEHWLTTDDIVALLLSLRGGRQGVPAGAAFWPVLYAIADASEAAAEAMSRALLAAESVSGVLLQRKGERGFAVRRHKSGGPAGGATGYSERRRSPGHPGILGTMALASAPGERRSGGAQGTDRDSGMPDRQAARSAGRRLDRLHRL